MNREFDQLGKFYQLANNWMDLNGVSIYFLVDYKLVISVFKYITLKTWKIKMIDYYFYQK